MQVSTRFSDSIHLLAFLDVYSHIKLSSETIAKSIKTSPVVVRRLMSTLKKAGLITTVHGSPNPKLAKAPTDISLLDVYLAIEGDKPLFEIDYKTNPDCIVGGNIQETLSEFYYQAQVAAQAKLNNISLQDVIDTILVKQKIKEHNRKEN